MHKVQITHGCVTITCAQRVHDCKVANKNCTLMLDVDLRLTFCWSLQVMYHKDKVFLPVLVHQVCKVSLGKPATDPIGWVFGRPCVLLLLLVSRYIDRFLSLFMIDLVIHSCLMLSRFVLWLVNYTSCLFSPRF